MIERDTTLEERLTWGDCPICGAKHGEYCLPTALQLGTRLDGKPMTQGEGVHLARIQHAPRRVRLVPA